VYFKQQTDKSFRALTDKSINLLVIMASDLIQS